MILTTPDTVTAIKFLPYKLLGAVCSSQYKVERVEINDDRKQLRVPIEPEPIEQDHGDPDESEVEVQVEAEDLEGEPSDAVSALDDDIAAEEPTVPIPTAREAVSIPLIKFTYTK